MMDRLLAVAMREVGRCVLFHAGSPHSPSSLLMLVCGLSFERFAAVCREASVLSDHN
jgi:hypothetical protein